jgi:hypothetical protein
VKSTTHTTSVLDVLAFPIVYPTHRNTSGASYRWANTIRPRLVPIRSDGDYQRGESAGPRPASVIIGLGPPR